MPREHGHRSTFGVLLIPVAMLAVTACSGGDDATDTVPLASPPSTSAPLTSVASTTSPAPTTVPPTAPATSAPSTSPAPTAPPTTGPPDPAFPFTGDTAEITSAFFVAPFAMQRAATAADLSAYDGVSANDGFAVRCVAITRVGASTWSEWCGDPDTSASFVVLDGIDPWLVDVGAAPGSVRLTKNPSNWAVVSGGCTEPLVSILAATQLGPSTATGIVCAGTEALVSFAQVFLQSGPADGGTALVSNGDEGWNLINSGTSLDCAGYDDGIDRCALFGVTDELFGTYPFPANTVLPAQPDAVDVRDESDAIRSAGDEAPDVDTIADRIITLLTPAEPEATPIVSLNRDAGWGMDALVVEVPALDDSIRSTVHIVWIAQPTIDRPASVTGAYAWKLCARGLADPTTCV